MTFEKYTRSESVPLGAWDTECGTLYETKTITSGDCVNFDGLGSTKYIFSCDATPEVTSLFENTFFNPSLNKVKLYRIHSMRIIETFVSGPL